MRTASLAFLGCLLASCGGRIDTGGEGAVAPSGRGGSAPISAGGGQLAGAGGSAAKGGEAGGSGGTTGASAGAASTGPGIGGSGGAVGTGGSAGGGDGGTAGSQSGIGGSSAVCTKPSVEWAKAFADSHDATITSVTTGDGDVYVWIDSTKKAFDAFPGCPQKSGPKGQPAGHLARFSADGECQWSLALAIHDGVTSPFVRDTLVAVQGGVALADPAWILVKSDSSSMNLASSPLMEGATLPVQLLPAANGDATLLSITAPSGILASTRIGPGKAPVASWSLPLQSPGNKIGVLMATARADASTVAIATVVGASPSFGLPAAPGGGMSLVAFEIDSGGAVAWSKLLAQTGASVSVPPVESEDGTLSFFAHPSGNTVPGDGLSFDPKAGTVLFQRSPSGSWSATSYPVLGLTGALSLPGGRLVAVANGPEIDLGKGLIQGESHATSFVVGLDACGSVSTFGTASTWVTLRSLSPLGNDVFVSGVFGASDAAGNVVPCAPASLHTGATSLSAQCQGVFGMRLTL